MKKVRVRYAPSPTGHLHIGNARTALFNYLYAKNLDGDFIIRIEDTDIARNIENGEQSQLDNLKWLGVEWDESIDKGGNYGPYNQLKRHEEGIYQEVVDQLLANGSAYKCFCTSQELEDAAELQKANGEIPKYTGKCRHLTAEQVAELEQSNLDYTIRFKVKADTDYTWEDMVKSNVTFNSKDVSGDFNIVKRDGIPTYNFAVVVDDHLMEISHVLRGEDHISNTPKQLMIYEAMGWEAPQFGHMTLIVNPQGKKLSKRDEGIVQFIEQYKNLGYLPTAMFNFITLLGWSPVGEEEIFSKEQFIEMFDAKRLSKSPAKFDVDKLMWINNNYIQRLTDDQYFELVKPFMIEAYPNTEYSEDQLMAIALLYKKQINYGKEIQNLISLFFKDELELDDEAVEFMKQDGIIPTIDLLSEKITNLPELTVENFKATLKEIQAELGVKGKMLFMPSRIATTGQMHGPELGDTVALLGKTKVLANIQTVKNLIN